PQGVLVLDPLHPALARLMAPALRRELEGPLESSRRIEVAASLLEGQGFEAQLRRPAGATNLFLEDEAGERQLLRQEGRDFVAGGRRYHLKELERLLDDFPDRLTPAAGLRPIIQDSLLPTVAFVVGPGEIGYGAQLREVYALHGLEQPLLWPRLSVTWLESNVSRLLARLGVSAARLMTDPKRVLGEALAAQRGAASVSGTQLDTLRLEFGRLSDELAGLDPTLAGAARRVRERSLGGLERLQGLAARALARAEDDRSRQLTRLKLHLLPNGVPQEREMNFLTYLLKHGDEPLRQLMEQQPGGSVELELR
ncbi:MAG: bacillithiol biosynthesis protein BshC, partial [Deinococcus sp.]